VQLFTIVLEQPIPFGISLLLAATICLIVLKSAMSSEERRPRWVRTLTSSNMRILMTLLFIGWAVVFGLGLQLVPHEGSNSPYGGIGLIALFSGFFIMMGFLWAVIGE
jgi:hypothetical protein